MVSTREWSSDDESQAIPLGAEMLGMGLPYVAALIVNGLILALIVFVPLGVLAYLTVRVIRTKSDKGIAARAD